MTMNRRQMVIAGALGTGATLAGASAAQAAPTRRRPRPVTARPVSSSRPTDSSVVFESVPVVFNEAAARLNLAPSGSIVQVPASARVRVGDMPVRLVIVNDGSRVIPAGSTVTIRARRTNEDTSLLETAGCYELVSGTSHGAAVLRPVRFAGTDTVCELGVSIPAGRSVSVDLTWRVPVSVPVSTLSNAHIIAKLDMTSIAGEYWEVQSPEISTFATIG
ncbi:MAG: hypothetical protein Q4P78_07595 [Rothia sp. (in: high G+C Gram-positive bacteria)]|uniref:hypothetical protein n=1 Tax=Rothia sp. (in: high G+C Gram-positive bacteria) TaxID=1885016 RepID=UPI0026DF6085|nr:hypothetical protein [Rothia sp. (in: high G+C Gram-positive bacteria)]MDO5751041.1 hypothetical protein [Rothia sp. (in: high G+C Gram-positive bacteria)]